MYNFWSLKHSFGAPTTVLAIAAMSIGAVVVASAPVRAADLNDGYYKPRAGSPYDDPRYADLYGDDRDGPRYAYRREKHRRGGEDTIELDQYGNYVERRRYDDVRPHRYGSSKDTPTPPRYAEPRHGAPGYAAPKYAAPRYEAPRYEAPRFRDEPGYRRFRLADHCVPRPVVIRRLQRDGWYAFAQIDLKGPRASVTADNDNGGRYRLVIDRCSGEILKASRIEYRQTGWRRSSPDRWRRYN